MNIQPRKYKLVLIIATLLIFIILSSVAVRFAPLGFDWQNAYRPAVQLVIHGQSPYHFGKFFNPPWLLIILAPLALLPEKIGFGIYFVSSFIGFAYLAFRMGAKPIAFFFFLASQPVIACIKTGNVDWIALLGILMPPQIGMLFILIKPQVGIGIALYWSWQALKNEQMKGLIKLYIPTIIAILISLFFFGLWPLDVLKEYSLSEAIYNDSIWPIGIPIGLVLLANAFKNKNKLKMLASTPFLSPYVLMQSWSGMILSLTSSNLETAAVVIGMYIIGIIKITS